MDESRALQRAGWAGAASVVLLAVGVALGYLVGVDDPSMSDSAILERLNDDARQVAAGIGMPVLAAGVALLLWFATGLRRVLDRLSGGDPLAHAIVPAAALFGGLMITGVSLDVASAYAALSDEFTPDADTVRALGMAGSVLALTGLIGGGVLVAVTTRIAQQARALPAWAVWASYAVAGLSLTGFWSGGMASVAFALWLIGAVIGVLRAARRTPPAPAVPAQGAPAPEAGRTPPTATSGCGRGTSVHVTPGIGEIAAFLQARHQLWRGLTTSRPPRAGDCREGLLAVGHWSDAARPPLRGAGRVCLSP